MQKLAPAGSKSNIEHYAPILLILAGAWALRFFLLSGQSLWVDEGLSLDRTSGRTLGETLGILFNSGQYDRYQPLYFTLLYLWRTMFGASEFAIRSFSAIMGGSAVIVVYLTALRVYGAKRALWTALLMAVSSFCVYYSQEARPYALLTFLVALQLYFFSFAFVRASRYQKGMIGLFWLTTALSISASVFVCLFTTALCLSHLAVVRNGKAWLRWWGVPFVLLLVAAFVYWSQRFHLLGSIWELTLSTTNHIGFSTVYNAVFVLYGILVGRSYGPPVEALHTAESKLHVVAEYGLPLALLALSGGLVLWGLVTRFWRTTDAEDTARSFDLLLAVTFVLSFVLAAGFAMVTSINWLPRHSFYLSVLAFLLIPAAFASRQSLATARVRVPMLARIATILLLGLNLVSLYNYYFVPAYAKDDYRAAARYARAHQGEATRSVLLWGSVPLLRYYGDMRTKDGSAIDPHQFSDQIKPYLSQADTALIMINREFYWDRQDELSVASLMPRAYRLDAKVTYPFFHIYRFVHTRRAEASAEPSG